VQQAPTPISYEEFAKVELRVAKIVAAEPVPKSKKLLKLEVDLGSERRTLVAGIAGAYAPDALVGRTVIVVANLQPAKLMGVESNGMMLAASTDDGRPVLLTLDDVRAAPPGSKVK
jgi:methionyl-tRNA synthetase